MDSAVPILEGVDEHEPERGHRRLDDRIDRGALHPLLAFE